MSLKFIDDPSFEVEGKKVLVRFDYNVPLDKKDSTVITDTTRVDLTLPTLKYILEKRPSKVIIMSHLGRPKGQVVPEFGLEPVAKYLAQVLNEEVVLTETAKDSGIKTLLGLNSPRVILLQNLRYHPEEEKNDHEFSKLLASYGDIYVNDAFGTCHRKHASTYGVMAFFKKKTFGGFVLKKEIKALDQIVENPKKPFMALLGGAKVSDKIKVIEKLLPNVDSLLIGGAMAYPFLKAQGHNIGKSLCSDEDVSLAKSLLNDKFANRIMIPQDHVVSQSLNGEPETISEKSIPDDKIGLDIGAKTVSQYKEKLGQAKTILWNGPMGLFENQSFSKGTYALAEVLANSDAFTLVGGGDSVSALKNSGRAESISHISTGGGASLEYIENGSLPGIQGLKFGVEL
jgi:phosphoglycerate kinase